VAAADKSGDELVESDIEVESPTTAITGIEVVESECDASDYSVAKGPEVTQIITCIGVLSTCTSLYAWALVHVMA
jgi:hypothetical protein